MIDRGDYAVLARISMMLGKQGDLAYINKIHETNNI